MYSSTKSLSVMFLISIIISGCTTRKFEGSDVDSRAVPTALNYVLPGYQETLLIADSTGNFSILRVGPSSSKLAGRLPFSAAPVAGCGFR
jgi:hypothetical protein